MAVAFTSTISGVATSVTAFVGRALRGPVDQPVAITSMADFDRTFGGRWSESDLADAVADFFRHGGGVAVVVRAHAPRDGDTAVLSFGDVGDDRLVLRASSPGLWGSKLAARLHEDGGLTVFDTGLGLSESFPELSLVVVDVRPERLPAAQAATVTPATNDGDPPDLAAYRRALAALERGYAVNLLVMPGAVTPEVVDEGVAFAERRKAVYVADPPPWATVGEAVAGAEASTFPRSPNVAVYFPSLRGPRRARAASGAVAGVIARTDLTSGVWTAPAGLEATLDGVELEVALTEADTGRLNPLGVNSLRTMRGVGTVVWGSRTTASSPDWKYVSVRRMAIFLEESLDRGTRWARFETNDERLWDRVRQEVAAFLEDLFRRGAFAGTTARDAYMVTCDGTTTTQDDIDQGVMNVVVGFAPLRPAEFVIVRVQQPAGQTAAVRNPPPVSELGDAPEPSEPTSLDQ